ncbi:MAG: hypothetical protein OXK72_00710 [Gammaproteobacteria bacterium]|nr:hypothetical protein [Gammaproteobacteria bacterium]
MAIDDWKAKAEKWKAESKKREAIAKSYEACYGWINDQLSWCSRNNSVDMFSNYDSPNCIKRSEPFYVIMKNCADWEIQSYKSDLETWATCRKNCIHDAQDDAGCALLQIREGIDQAIEGN